MKRPIGRFFLSMTIAGCIASSCTHKPYHPEKSDRQWALDHEACQKTVRSEIRGEPYAYDHFDEMRLIKQCMRNKGWQWERTDWFRLRHKKSE